MSQYSHIPILDAPAAAGVASLVEYEAKETAYLERQIRLRRIVGLVDSMITLPAYVSDNRYVANCIACNGGILLAKNGREGWPCWDCGTVYRIEWPQELAEAEAALRERVPRLRNYYSETELAVRMGRLTADTPEMLRWENETFGLDHHSWTSPRTWTTGEVVTAAIMNTHVRDNLNETAPAKATTDEDIIVATAANTIDRLAVGSNTQVLTVVTGSVAWA